MCLGCATLSCYYLMISALPACCSQMLLPHLPLFPSYPPTLPVGVPGQTPWRCHLAPLAVGVGLIGWGAWAAGLDLEAAVTLAAG